MRPRALRDACLGGFLYGALLYGGVLSLVHVLHNHLGSARDALIVYAGFLLLYGLWSAAFFALAGLAVIPFSRPEVRGRRGLWLGLLVFNLFFWEVFFLYGLTYDQAPFHPAGKWGMAGVLVLLALPIALGVDARLLAPVPAFRGPPARRARVGGRGAPGDRDRGPCRGAALRRRRGAAREAERDGSGDPHRRYGPEGDPRRLRRRGLAGDPADDGEGGAPHLRRDRPGGDDRPPGIDPRLELGRHLGLDLHGDDARAARRPRLLPDRVPGDGVEGDLPGPPHLFQGAVRPRGAPGADQPDPGRPLLDRGASGLGDRRPGGALDRGRGRLLLLLSGAPPVEAGELVLLLRAGRDGGAPLAPGPPVPAAAVVLPGFPSVPQGRRLPLAVRDPAEASGRAAASQIRQLLQPRAGQRPALVLEVVRAGALLPGEGEGRGGEGADHPRRSTATSTGSWPASSPRPGRTRSSSSPRTTATARRSSTASTPSTGTALRASC